MVPQRVDRGDLDIIAPPDGEGESVPLVSVGRVGAQDDVCGRVVGVRVHRVGAVELARGGETDVVGVDRGDAGGGRGHGRPFGRVQGSGAVRVPEAGGSVLGAAGRHAGDHEGDQDDPAVDGLDPEGRDLGEGEQVLYNSQQEYAGQGA